MVVYARKYLEDYVSTLSPPSRESFVTVNALNVEKGILDVDVHSNVASKISQRINSGLWLITEKSVEAGLNYNWNTLLIKFKRSLDLDFIPPYDGRSLLFHFIIYKYNSAK